MRRPATTRAITAPTPEPSRALVALAAVVTLALAAAAVLVSVAAPRADAAPVAAASRPDAPLRYAALGDSYSSAAGVLPVVPDAPAQCLRSTRNYAHVIAGRIGADLTDVTCSGAETSDFFSSQFDGVAPQLRALGKRTQLATMSIGGNDNGVFTGAIEKCGAAAATTGGTGSPCRNQYGSEFVDTIRTSTYPNLQRAFAAVHRRAPNADVAVLGYPWILPPKVGCFPQMPVAKGDVPYLRNLEATLNRVVQKAATQNGLTYVDFSKVSEGHDACQAIGTRWIEPVVGGTNPVVVHPNAFGERRMADRTMRVLGLS